MTRYPRLGRLSSFRGAKGVEMPELSASTPSSANPAAVPLVRLRYRNPDAFLDAWLKALTEGSLWVAGVPPRPAQVRVQLQVGDAALQPLRATVVERDTGYGL